MKYMLMLDLKESSNLIAEYEAHHRAVWPEVLAHLQLSGVKSMHIWRLGNRLVMLMHTKKEFSFERMAELAQQNEAVVRWEKLMWDYQQPTPFTDSGVKWQRMTKIFDFNVI